MRVFQSADGVFPDDFNSWSVQKLPNLSVPEGVGVLDDSIWRDGRVFRDGLCVAPVVVEPRDARFFVIFGDQRPKRGFMQ